MNIECTNDALDEIKSAFKFNDAVIRNLIIRRDTAETDPSHLVKSKEKDGKDGRDDDRGGRGRRRGSSGERPAPTGGEQPGRKWPGAAPPRQPTAASRQRRARRTVRPRRRAASSRGAEGGRGRRPRGNAGRRRAVRSGGRRRRRIRGGERRAACGGRRGRRLRPGRRRDVGLTILPGPRRLDPGRPPPGAQLKESGNGPFFSQAALLSFHRRGREGDRLQGSQHPQGIHIGNREDRPEPDYGDEGTGISGSSRGRSSGRGSRAASLHRPASLTRGTPRGRFPSIRHAEPPPRNRRIGAVAVDTAFQLRGGGGDRARNASVRHERRRSGARRVGPCLRGCDVGTRRFDRAAVLFVVVTGLPALALCALLRATSSQGYVLATATLAAGASIVVLYLAVADPVAWWTESIKTFFRSPLPAGTSVRGSSRRSPNSSRPC